MITEDELQKIVSTVCKIFSVEKILLFGSYARGDAHEHSDLNLCVLITPAAGRSQEMQERSQERKQIQEEYHSEGEKAKGKKPWWKFWGSDESDGKGGK